jgi:hypothetical protein
MPKHSHRIMRHHDNFIKQLNDKTKKLGIKRIQDNLINVKGDGSILEYTKGLFTVVTKGCDQSFSCIVIGGKVGVGPSSLYTVKSDQSLQWMKK